jgi:hypothetical protein
LNIFSSIHELEPKLRFNLITLWHVLEHIPNPVEELQRLSDILTDDGILFISVPNFGGWTSMLAKSKWFHLDAPRHIHHFTPGSLRLLLEKSGIKIVSLTTSISFYAIFGIFQTLLNMSTGTMNLLYYYLKRGIDYNTSRSKLKLAGVITLHVLLSPLFLAVAVIVTTVASLFTKADTIEVICARN